MRHVLAGRSMVGTMQVCTHTPCAGRQVYGGHHAGVYTYAMCWQAGPWWAPCRCVHIRQVLAGRSMVGTVPMSVKIPS